MKDSLRQIADLSKKALNAQSDSQSHLFLSEILVLIQELKRNTPKTKDNDNLEEILKEFLKEIIKNPEQDPYELEINPIKKLSVKKLKDGGRQTFKFNLSLFYKGKLFIFYMI